MGNQPKQNLYQAIITHKHTQAQIILATNPQLATQTLTTDCKSTAIGKAAALNDIRMVRILLSFGCHPDFGGQKGMTALMWAAIKNHLKIVQALIENHNSDVNIISRDRMNALDYAIIYGSYQCALYLWKKVKPTHSAQDYELIMRNLKCIDINYTLMMECLSKGIRQPPELRIRKKQEFDDPVVDPRQSWKQWVWRVSEFKDPPFVQRKELPDHLRPENRRFGWLREKIARTVNRYPQ